MRQQTKPLNFDIKCHVRISQRQVILLQKSLEGICCVYKAAGLLVFDASMPKYHSTTNATVKAAKWTSLTMPVMLHTKPVHSIIVYNGRLVGRAK